MVSSFVTEYHNPVLAAVESDNSDNRETVMYGLGSNPVSLLFLVLVYLYGTRILDYVMVAKFGRQDERIRLRSRSEICRVAIAIVILTLCVLSAVCSFFYEGGGMF